MRELIIYMFQWLILRLIRGSWGKDVLEIIGRWDGRWTWSKSGLDMFSESATPHGKAQTWREITDGPCPGAHGDRVFIVIPPEATSPSWNTRVHLQVLPVRGNLLDKKTPLNQESNLFFLTSSSLVWIYTICLRSNRHSFPLLFCRKESCAVFSYGLVEVL